MRGAPGNRRPYRDLCPPAIAVVASTEDSERGARRTGPAVESMYRFVLWLVPTVEKFPRRQKFLLGDRLQATALEVAVGARLQGRVDV